MKISVVINTINEEKNIKRALESVKWADEIVVCDMHSEDKTVEIAKGFGVKVVFHEKTGYVEPARNFAVSSAAGDWILVLDADEEIPETLARELREVAEYDLDFVEIPRKNIIFGRFMKASMWWPDYNIRFFRKGSVVWSNKIHRPPEASGKGIKLAAEEGFAIIHHNYTSVSQFVSRMDRYSTIEAEGLKNSGYKFTWTDLINKPLGEFLGRYFANRGFEDGLHGLALSLLQAFSFLIVYLKVWELQKFDPQEINFKELTQAKKEAGCQIDYWLEEASPEKSPLRAVLKKVKRGLTR